MYCVYGSGQETQKWAIEVGKVNPLVFNVFNVTEMITPVLMLVISVLALVGASYNPFLYFQF